MVQLLLSCFYCCLAAPGPADWSCCDLPCCCSSSVSFSFSSPPSCCEGALFADEVWTEQLLSFFSVTDGRQLQLLTVTSSSLEAELPSQLPSASCVEEEEEEQQLLLVDCTWERQQLMESSCGLLQLPADASCAEGEQQVGMRGISCEGGGGGAQRQQQLRRRWVIHSWIMRARSSGRASGSLRKQEPIRS